MSGAEAEAMRPESAHVAPCHVTRWPTLFTAEAHRVETLASWDELFATFERHNRFAGEKAHPGWSPVEFVPPQRSLENVRRIFAVCFDYDGGTSIEDAEECWAGHFGFLHTTRRHTPEQPRFRVILPLRRSVSAFEYQALWTRLAARTGEVVDPQTKDPSRFWFVPGTPEGGEYETRRLDGAPLDPDEILSQPEPRVERVSEVVSAPTYTTSATDIERRAIAYLDKMEPAISGSGGHVATWRAALALAQGFDLGQPTVLRLLTDHYNPRCQPPWSPKELKHKAQQASEVANRVRRGYLLDDDRRRDDDWQVETEHLVRELRERAAGADSPAPLAKVEPDRPSADRACSPASVLDGWLREGALIHEPTGIVALDDATGGGPVYGSRVYVAGAPDAAKTALVVQIADTLAKRNIAVGMLAVDEEAGDLVTRFAQRHGFSRQDCERREPSTVQAIRDRLAGLPLRFYGPEWTIERAAADLAAFAKARGSRAMLGIDSIQVVRCNAEETAEREMSMPTAMEARVRAVRAVAQEHGLITIATSEMARGGYRNSSDRIDPMAASKWSGAIEYSARVLISLRSVKGSPDVIELEIPKNKHGRRRLADEGEAIYLEIDRRRQTLTETEPPAKAEAADKRAAADAARDARVEQLASKIETELVKAGARGILIKNQRELRALVRGKSEEKADAISLLISSGRIQGGRGAAYGLRHAETDDDAEGPSADG